MSAVYVLKSAENIHDIFSFTLTQTYSMVSFSQCFPLWFIAMSVFYRRPPSSLLSPQVETLYLLSWSCSKLLLQKFHFFSAVITRTRMTFLCVRFYFTTTILSVWPLWRVEGIGGTQPFPQIVPLSQLISLCNLQSALLWCGTRPNEWGA